MKVISFLNMKGGVAKTTSSINSAVGLANKGYRVLLIDFAPQANTTYNFCTNPKFTINDLLNDTATLEQVLLKTNQTNLWIIPSELALAQTEATIRVQTNAPQHNRLEKILKQVEDEFDFVIIDCDPIINILTINVIIASSLIIIPVKPDVYALQGFTYTTNNINDIKKNFELDVDYKVLFTSVNRNNADKEMIEEITNFIPDKVFKSQIRSQSKPISIASLSKKAVITENQERVGVAKDYQEFVDELEKQ